MAFPTTTCCLKPPPPPRLLPKFNQGSWPKKEESTTSWRKQCFVGMTCMVMMGSEMMPMLGADCCATARAEELVIISETPKRNTMRWSDKRSCPPWQLNSLETIVPENLPRPSAQRRSETVRLSGSNPSSQMVRLRFRTVADCFSM